MPPLPLAVDLRPGLPTVKDQGRRGTCVAFAVTGGHEAERAGGGPVVEDLAEEVLYWGCKQVDGDYAPGTSLASAEVAVGQWGQPDEQLWPYDPLRVDTDASYVPPPGAIEPGACHKTNLTRFTLDVDAIRRYLDRGRTVLLALIVNDVFDDPPAGRIPMPLPHQKFTEGHALLIVGYIDDALPAEGVFVVRNSWGEGWGDGGYGYLPYAYIRLYGRQAWVVGRP